MALLKDSHTTDDIKQNLTILSIFEQVSMHQPMLFQEDQIVSLSTLLKHREAPTSSPEKSSILSSFAHLSANPISGAIVKK